MYPSTSSCRNLTARREMWIFFRPPEAAMRSAVRSDTPRRRATWRRVTIGVVLSKCGCIRTIMAISGPAHRVSGPRFWWMYPFKNRGMFFVDRHCEQLPVLIYGSYSRSPPPVKAKCGGGVRSHPGSLRKRIRLSKYWRDVGPPRHRHTSAHTEQTATILPST